MSRCQFHSWTPTKNKQEFYLQIIGKIRLISFKYRHYLNIQQINFFIEKV